MKRIVQIAIALMIIISHASSLAFLPGDIDNSGDIDLKDAITALRLSSGLDANNPIYLADVDGDGKTGLADAIYALQCLGCLRKCYSPILDIAVNTSSINVAFDRDMDESTITTDSITVTRPGENRVYGYDVDYNNRIAIFTFHDRLLHNGLYTFKFTGTIKDQQGNPLPSDYKCTFTAGPGIFRDYSLIPTGSWPQAVAIGDVNNDGRNDVVMTTFYEYDDADNFKLFVFIQNDEGELQPPVKYETKGLSQNSAPRSVAIGDVNNDGRNDIVVGLFEAGIGVFLQNNDGTFGPGILYPSVDSSKIRIVDLNRDGLLDVVGIGEATDTVSIWLQNGNGTFNIPTVYEVSHDGYDDLDTGDINNDGLTDIIVMSGQGLSPNLGVLTQKPDGTFNTPVYYWVGAINDRRLTHGVAVGDINGDGLNDIVVTFGGNYDTEKLGFFIKIRPAL